MPHQPIARRGETSRKRSIIVAAMFLACDFLAIGILECHLHLGSFHCMIIVALLIDPQADALVLDDLPRPIKRAVREKNRLALCFKTSAVVRGILMLGAEFSPIMTGAKEIVLVHIPGKSKEPVLIGAHRSE